MRLSNTSSRRWRTSWPTFKCSSKITKKLHRLKSKKREIRLITCLTLLKKLAMKQTKAELKNSLTTFNCTSKSWNLAHSKKLLQFARVGLREVKTPMLTNGPEIKSQ